MKTDEQIQSDVTAELMWDPSVTAANVGVAVKEGVVTLSGTVDTYAQKHAVERATRRVSGIRGIAVDLEVRLTTGHERSDAEIAQAALHALRWQSLVSDEKVQVQVEDGWLTLSGEVDWGYQSASAEQCVRPLVGVTGVSNEIRIKQHVNARNLQSDIAAALERHAQREARHLQIEVDGGVVTLTGTVGTLAEHEAAMGTAATARGVTRVIDRIDIAP